MFEKETLLPFKSCIDLHMLKDERMRPGAGFTKSPLERTLFSKGRSFLGWGRPPYNSVSQSLL